MLSQTLEWNANAHYVPGQKDSDDMSQNNGNVWPEDEKLVAYADGMLDPLEHETIARFLDTNEEARQFVERLAASGKLAKAAYEEALNCPASDRKLEALIMASAAPAGVAQKSNVIAMKSRTSRLFSGARTALPLAASIALVFGGLAGFELGRRGATPGIGSGLEVAVGAVGKGSPIATLLEQKSSGDPLHVAAGGRAAAQELMVIATFRDQAGGICREFEMLPAGEPGAKVTSAVACRQSDGLWHINGAVQVAAGQPASGKDFGPASGKDALAIEGILKSLGATPALSREDEAGLMKSGWK